MKALYRTPQNNFKISTSNGFIYNNEKLNYNDKKDINSVLEIFFSFENSISNDLRILNKKINKIKKRNSHKNGIDLNVNVNENENENENENKNKNNILLNQENSQNEENFNFFGVTNIINVLTCILKSENVLRNISSLQSLDFLDMEGLKIIL